MCILFKSPYLIPSTLGNITSLGGQRLNSRLAILAGESKLTLGRERHEGSKGGVEIDVKAGDVIVVPAGVSHRSLTATDDYRYIGVYPEVC